MPIPLPVISKEIVIKDIKYKVEYFISKGDDLSCIREKYVNRFRQHAVVDTLIISYFSDNQDKHSGVFEIYGYGIKKQEYAVGIGGGGITFNERDMLNIIKSIDFTSVCEGCLKKNEIALLIRDALLNEKGSDLFKTGIDKVEVV